MENNNEVKKEKKVYKYDKVKYNKDYYERHKNKLLISAKEKIECPICKKMLSRANISVHNKGDKHQLKLKLAKLPQ